MCRRKKRQNPGPASGRGRECPAHKTTREIEPNTKEKNEGEKTRDVQFEKKLKWIHNNTWALDTGKKDELVSAVALLSSMLTC